MTPTVVVFGDFELDLATHELRRNGTPVPVEPQVFDVLAHLIEHRDRMVPKNELLDEVWGDRFVSESALTSRIKAARQAIGDNGRDQRLIRTVHGRGYRFVGDVVDDEADPATGTVGSVAADVAAGRGRAVVVTGPPGRARGALLFDAYQDALAAGLLVGRGGSAHGRVLGGVLDALDELVQRRPELLDRVPASCRTELEAAFRGESPTTIGRLQLSARELVLAAAADGVVVVLQDLELADRATLVLVEQCALATRRVALGLVVSHRDPSVLAGFDVLRAEVGAEPDEHLAGLPDDVIAVLTRLALCGPVIEPSVLAAAAGVDDELLDRVLGVAVDAGLLEREGEGLRFTSEAEVDALVGALGPRRRAELGSELAWSLAGAGATPGSIARLHRVAGDPAAAAPYFLAEAQEAAAMHDHLAVIQACEEAIPHAEGALRAELLALRGLSLAYLGDVRAVPVLREALADAQPERVRGLRLALARAANLTGDLEGAAAVMAGIEPDGGEDDALVLLLQGYLACHRGDLDDAAAAVATAKELATGPGSPGVLLDLMTLEGMIAHQRGEWFDRLRRELRSTRDDPALASKVFDGQLCVAEYLLYGPVPYEEVVGLARDLQAASRASGAPRAEAFALCLSGEAYLLAGRLEEARADLEESLRMHEALHADSGVSLCLQRLAEVELAEGDPEAAQRSARRSLVAARWSPLARHLLQRAYGTLIAAAPDAEAAVAVVDEADAAVDDATRCRYCDVALDIPATIALAGVGRTEEAEARLARAKVGARAWHGEAWDAGVTEAEAAVALVAGRGDDAVSLLLRAAELFDRAGQPLDAARCREAAEG